MHVHNIGRHCLLRKCTLHSNADQLPLRSLLIKSKRQAFHLLTPPHTARFNYLFVVKEEAEYLLFLLCPAAVAPLCCSIGMFLRHQDPRRSLWHVDHRLLARRESKGTKTSLQPSENKYKYPSHQPLETNEQLTLAAQRLSRCKGQQEKYPKFSLKYSL